MSMLPCLGGFELVNRVTWQCGSPSGQQLPHLETCSARIAMQSAVCCSPCRDDLVSTEYLAVPGSGYGQHHGAHNSPDAAAGPPVLQSLAPSRQQQQAGSLTHQVSGTDRSS